MFAHSTNLKRLLSGAVGVGVVGGIVAAGVTFLAPASSLSSSQRVSLSSSGYSGKPAGIGAARAESACQRAASAWHATAVEASYQSTRGAVQKWRESRTVGEHPVYPSLSATQAGMPTAVCYLAGSFTGIPSAPGASATYKKIIVEVDETTGATTLDAANPGQSWPFAAPPTS